jgi:hypothetical protein
MVYPHWNRFVAGRMFLSLIILRANTISSRQLYRLFLENRQLGLEDSFWLICLNGWTDGID